MIPSRASDTELLEFDWLGTRVRVRSGDPELTRMVRRSWGSLASSGGSDEPSEVRRYHLLLRPGSPPRLRGPGFEAPLDGRFPVLHAYNLLLADLLGTASDHFLFHATSVARDGRALLVSGPSTFGKTTLGIQLARTRGFGLLADDVTVIERSTSRVQPLRKSLTLRSGTREMIGEDETEAVRSAIRDLDGDEWAVDPAGWLGPPPEPAPVAMVVLLRPAEDGSGLRRFPVYRIRLSEGSESLTGDLSSLDGVAGVKTDPRHPGFAIVRAERVGPLLSWLGEHRDQVVYALKQPAAAPDFDRSPELTAIGTFQAATELTQEMLNRHEGSRVGEEFRGAEHRLVGEVARILREARCFALCPGRLDETLDLLANRLNEG